MRYKFQDRTTKKWTNNPVKIRNILKKNEFLKSFVGHYSASARVSGWGNYHGLIQVESFWESVENEPNVYFGNVCKRVSHNTYNTEVFLNKSWYDYNKVDLQKIKDEIIKTLKDYSVKLKLD